MRAVSLTVCLLSLLPLAPVLAQSDPASEAGAPAAVRFDDTFRRFGEGASDVPASQSDPMQPNPLQLAAGLSAGIGFSSHTGEGGGTHASKRVTLAGLSGAAQYGLGPRSAVRATLNLLAALGAEQRSLDTPPDAAPAYDDYLPVGALLDLEYSLRPAVGPVRLSLAVRAGYMGEVASSTVGGSFLVGGMGGLAFLLGHEQLLELHTRAGMVYSLADPNADQHVGYLSIPLELSVLYRFF